MYGDIMDETVPTAKIRLSADELNKVTHSGLLSKKVDNEGKKDVAIYDQERRSKNAAIYMRYVDDARRFVCIS